jgi:hypothetical protein
MGDDAFCMRESESCASFFVGSSCEVAIRSAYVTRPASALAIGGSEWHPVQLLARIVAMLHGTPVAAAVPPSLEVPPLELPDPELLDPEPPEPLELVDPTEPDELLDDPDAGPGLLGPHPATTIFSSGVEEHAAATTRAAAPSRWMAFMSEPVPARAHHQAGHPLIFAAAQHQRSFPKFR